jgi:hypothetical protein
VPQPSQIKAALRHMATPKKVVFTLCSQIPTPARLNWFSAQRSVSPQI